MSGVVKLIKQHGTSIDNLEHVQEKIEEMAVQLLHNLGCNNYELVLQASEDCCTKKLHISIILYKLRTGVSG